MSLETGEMSRKTLARAASLTTRTSTAFIQSLLIPGVVPEPASKMEEDREDVGKEHDYGR